MDRREDQGSVAGSLREDSAEIVKALRTAHWVLVGSEAFAHEGELCEDAADLIEAQASRIEALEAALDPFVPSQAVIDLTARLDDDVNGYAVMDGWEIGPISMADLRRARSTKTGGA